MARTLQFHPHRGFHVPGYPNTHHDAERVAKEARLRGMSDEAYVTGALAYRWPDGKPAFTLGAHADEALVAAVEPPAPAADAPAEDTRPRKRG